MGDRKNSEINSMCLFVYVYLLIRRASRGMRCGFMADKPNYFCVMMVFDIDQAANITGGVATSSRLHMLGFPLSRHP